MPDYLDQFPVDPFDSINLLKMGAVDGGLDLFSIGPAKDSGLNDADQGREQEESQKEKNKK